MRRFEFIGLGSLLAWPILLVGQAPPPGRQCATSPAPKTLPAIAEIADSAALVDAVQSRRFHPALLDGRPVEVWFQETRVEVVRP